MLGEPLNSPYDVHFKLFGFNIRVTWLFWVVAAGLGYQWASVYDEIYFRSDQETPGMAVLLVFWVAAVFLSILIHELGHAFVMRHYNISSYVVLYHFGGLAVPNTFRQFSPGKNKRTGYGPEAQLLISLAGPVAQILFAVAVGLIAYVAGFHSPFTQWLRNYFDIDTSHLMVPTNAATRALIDFTILPSVYWALLNLLPVLPLDGGRILQHAWSMFQGRNAVYEATVVSIVVAFLVAFWGLNNESMMGLMFLMLGILNLQNLRSGVGPF